MQDTIFHIIDIEPLFKRLIVGMLGQIIQTIPH